MGIAIANSLRVIGGVSRTEPGGKSNWKNHTPNQNNHGLSMIHK